MRRRLGVMLLGFAVGTHGHTVAAEDVPFRDNFKTAKDGVTKGWLVKYPWPDKEDASQSWRTIAGRLVLSRNGHVIRVLHAIDFWSWDFWAGGERSGVRSRSRPWNDFLRARGCSQREDFGEVAWRLQGSARRRAGVGAGCEWNPFAPERRQQ